MLRLYIATFQATFVFTDLEEYIINVYIPVWFSIKKQNNFTGEASHFFKLINFPQSKTKSAPDNVNKILRKHAHHNNILIAMFVNDTLRV